jgi:hypothetical protein
MSLQYPDYVVPSDTCRECGGRGTVYEWGFECSKVTRPCPVCRPKAQRLEAARAALAREFGRDRRPKTAPQWADPRMVPDAEILARVEREDGALDGVDVEVAS